MSFKIYHEVNPSTLTLAEDHDLLIYACESNIRIHRLSSCELLKVINENFSPVVALFRHGNVVLSLHRNGALLGVDLRTFSLTSEVELGVEIQGACVSANLEHLVVKPLGQNQLYVYDATLLVQGALKYDTFDTHATAGSSGKGVLLEMSPDGRFLFYVAESYIRVFNVNDGSVVHKMKHTYLVTSITAQNNNEFLAVGDVTGRITYYYLKMDAKKQGKVVSSTSHWHAHKVTSLRLLDNNTQMISGGEEGVLVFWHLVTQNKTFCPRLGATITQILLTAKNDKAVVLLSSNLIKIVKLQNFEESGVINGVSLDFKGKKAEAKTNYVSYPKSNTYATKGSPETVQFVNFIELKKQSEFHVNHRNPITKAESDWPNPMQVEQICFDEDAKYMVTFEKRTTLDSNFKLNYLKFWDQTGLFNFTLNTSIEAIHEGNITLLKSFTSTKTAESYFVSFGDDKLLQIWRRYRLADQSTGKGLGDITYKYYWRSHREFTYKGLTVNDVKYCSNWMKEDREVLLLSLPTQIVLLDFLSLNVISIIKTSTESLSTSIVDINSNAGFIHLVNSKGLWGYSIEDRSFRRHIPLSEASCHHFDNANSILYVAVRGEKEEKEVSLLLEIDLKTYKLTRSFTVPDRTVQILLSKEGNNKNLIAITDATSNYVIPLVKGKGDDKISRVLSFSHRESALGIKPRTGTKAFAQATQYSSDDLAKRKNFAIFDPRTIFHEKSHIMPPLKLLTSAVLGRMLEKVEARPDDYEQVEANESKMSIEKSNIEVSLLVNGNNESYDPSNESLSNENKIDGEAIPQDLVKKRFYAVKQLYKKKADE